MINVRIRKSKFMDWINCPYMYEQMWLKGKERRESVEMELGRRFHKLSGEFFDHITYLDLVLVRTVPDAYRLFQSLQAETDYMMKEWMNNFYFWEAREWIRLREMYPVNEAFIYWKPLTTELEINTDKAEYHFDRIDLLPNGCAIDIEYKTGKYFRKASLRKELTFYNIGANKLNLFNLHHSHIGYFNPRLNISWNEEVTQFQRNRTERLIRQFLKAHGGNDFPCKPSAFCAYCGVILTCPHWQNHKEVVRYA